MAEEGSGISVSSVFEAIKQQVQDRVGSPLFGTFLLSWISWNHKYLLILFCSAEIDKKLELTSGFYSGWPGFYHGFLFPLITAVLFLLIYPFPARWLYGFWHAQQIKLKELRNKIEKAQLLTKEEGQRLNQRNFELQEEKHTLSEQMQMLRAQMQNMQNGTVHTTPPPTPLKLDAPLEKLIQALSGHANYIGMAVLKSYFQTVPEVKINYYLDETRRLGLVEANGLNYQLTAAGRKYAVENKLV